MSHIVTSSQRATVWSSADHPYLEIIDAPAMLYNNTSHLHEDIEISWKSKGSWNLLARGETRTITSDTIVITPPEEPHAASSSQIVDGEFLGIRLHTGFLRETIMESGMEVLPTGSVDKSRQL